MGVRKRSERDVIGGKKEAGGRFEEVMRGV